jgi:hypothetical protein
MPVPLLSPAVVDLVIGLAMMVVLTMIGYSIKSAWAWVVVGIVLPRY